MSNETLKSVTIWVDGSAYEIVYNRHHLDSIIRYHAGQDGRGEIIPYEALGTAVQLAVYNRLKREFSRS